MRESGGRCEVVASRGNSLAFRVVGVRLLQVVAILLLLSLAVCQCSRWEQHGDMAAHKQLMRK